MNWLDIVIIVLWAIGFFTGLRMGLFGAIFTTGGLIVGVLLAGRFSDNVAELLTDSISSDTLVTVISYGVIILAVYIGAQFLKTVVKGIMEKVFLGWVDNLGALALGMVAGVVLSGALITGMARYSNDLPTELLDLESENTLVDMVRDKAIELVASGVQQKMNTTLVESSLVPIFLDIRSAIPGDALGLVPDDFSLALDLLEAQIEASEQE
jgi:membrane protein required for colicin V production